MASIALTVILLLAARNASATLCEEPIRDVSTMQGLLGVVGCSITLLIFFVRIVSNLSLNGGGFGWDGYLITAAMVATIGASVLAPICKYHAQYST